MTVVAPPPTRTVRPVRAWDIALTIALVVVLVGGAVLASFMGLFLVMASDSCGVVRCSTGVIGLGVLVATVGPWVIAVAATVVAIVLLVTRRIAFWVPIAGLALVIAVWLAGAAIAAAGVPMS